MSDKIFDKLIEHSLAGMEEILGEIGPLRIKDVFKHFDDKYIKPVVVYNYESQETHLMRVSFIASGKLGQLGLFSIWFWPN